jgi:hypothetical protein
MKKTILLLTIAAVVGIGSYFALAQDPRGGMMGRGMMNDNERMQQMGRGMMGWDGMGGPMMHGGSLVATPDGGVIVMMGNELMKYDKDLNLTKEVEIKFNWENWHKMMMEHRDMMMGESSK